MSDVISSEFHWVAKDHRAQLLSENRLFLSEEQINNMRSKDNWGVFETV